MKCADAVLLILAKDGHSKRWLSRQLGLTPQAVDNRLAAEKSMRCKTLVETLDVLGHELVIRPVDAADGETEIVIDG